jgi:hypothetical protein
MSVEPEKIALAEAAFKQLQLSKFAASPLAGMAAWMKAGRAPLASTLRQAGYTSDAERGDTWIIRRLFKSQWGFSIPCAEAINALYSLSPLVELGAGSGYWTALMRAAGADMVATDKVSEGSPGYNLTAGLHCQIEPLGGLPAVRTYGSRNVFCSWPSEGDDWCAEAAAAMQPGRYLGLISKGRGGNIGSDALFDLLDEEFAPKGHIAIPQFPGSADVLTFHQRR